MKLNCNHEFKDYYHTCNDAYLCCVKCGEDQKSIYVEKIEQDLAEAKRKNDSFIDLLIKSEGLWKNEVKRLEYLLNDKDKERQRDAIDGQLALEECNHKILALQDALYHIRHGGRNMGALEIEVDALLDGVVCSCK
jgi:hypothetical protein